MGRGILRRVLRVTGLLVLAGLLLFSALAYTVFQERNELILSKLEVFLHDNQSGDLDIGALDLRLLRNFPNLTLQIDSLVYHEQVDSLRPPDAMPIFQADRLFLAIRLIPLISGEVVVSEIGLENGRLNIQEDKAGILNLDRALKRPVKSKIPAKPHTTDQPAPRKPKAPSTPEKKPGTPSKAAHVNLEEISLSNLHIAWQVYGQSRPQRMLTRTLRLSIEKEDTTAEASVQLDAVAEDLRWNRARLPSSDISLEAAVTYHPRNGRLDFRSTTLTLDAFTIALSGFYDHRKARTLDLRLDASSNDLPLLSRLLNKKLFPGERELVRTGDIYLKGRVFGTLATQSPQADVEFGVTNLSLRIPGNQGDFRGLGFEGRFSTGAAANYSRALLDVRNIRGEIPGGYVKGDLFLSNLVRPYLRCQLQARLNLDGYDRVFNIDRVQDLKGTVQLNAHADGPLRLFGLQAKDPKPFFDISFSLAGLSFRLPDRPERFEDIGMEGRCISGSSRDFTNSSLELRAIRGKVPGGTLEGDVRITNFLEPFLHYRVASQMRLDGLDRLLKSGTIRDLRGRVELQGRFDGPLKLIGTHAMDSSRSSSLKFDSVSFVLSSNRKPVSDLSGYFENKNNVANLRIKGRYASSAFSLQASVENLMHRIFKNERSLDARGTLTIDQLFTRDILPDTLANPLIDDRLSDFSLAFRSITESDTALDRTQLGFSINHLSAKLDELPDIRKLTTSGLLVRQDDHYHLTLDAFQLALPQGQLELSGRAEFPGYRQLSTQARIKATRLPWVYVSEVVDELSPSQEPSRKSMKVDEMDLVTADLDVSADLRTYPFDFQRLELRNSRFSLVQANGKAFSTERLNASLEPFQFIHPANSGAITGLRAISGTLSMEKLKVPGFIDLNLTMQLTGRNDTLVADLTNVDASKVATGRLTLDLTPDSPAWKFHYEVKRMSVDKLISRFHKGKFLEGTMGYSVDFETQGATWSSAREHLNGSFEVRSDSLRLYGIDIDDILGKFQKSQRFNLTDLGAVVLAGPIGIVATKGTDFVLLAAIELHPDQQTEITDLLTRWTFRDQTLATEDVAFATTQNRIAFSGSVNFANDSIPGIHVAVVDKNGCSLMDQQLYGKFGKLKTGKLNVAKTLLGSVINFVDAIVGKDCKPVYAGKVRHPGSSH